MHRCSHPACRNSQDHGTISKPDASSVERFSIDASIVRTWLTGLGRRTAVSRMAHLLCELHHRLKAVGLVTEARFQLPVTQGDIADALGLSAVHVNRTLKKLRAQRLVSIAGQSVTITDGDGLGTIAGFDPTYLHFRKAGTD